MMEIFFPSYIHSVSAENFDEEETEPIPPLTQHSEPTVSPEVPDFSSVAEGAPEEAPFEPDMPQSSLPQSGILVFDHIPIFH